MKLSVVPEITQVASVRARFKFNLKFNFNLTTVKCVRDHKYRGGVGTGTKHWMPSGHLLAMDIKHNNNPTLSHLTLTLRG